MKKIVITGTGAVTPIGNMVSEYWNNLLDGRCGVGPITHFDASELPVRIGAEVKDFDPLNFMSSKKTREMDRFMQYGFAAAIQALTEASLAPKDPTRVGISVGTALGGITPIASKQAELTAGIHKKISPRFVTQIIGNELAAHIAIEQGFKGPSMTVSTACSSGGDAISLGCMMLQAGMADAVLAVGTESALTPVFILGLASAHALSTRNDDPRTASRPFDRDRDGFVMGEGGGALVLETEEHALSRGTKILGELAGFSNCTDGYHVTSPDPEGSGAIFCMEQAMKNANLTPSDIGYINTHGTSTVVGDVIEADAIHKVFCGDKTSGDVDTSRDGYTANGSGDGDKATGDDNGSSGGEASSTCQGGDTAADNRNSSCNSPCVSSTKGATGHMMGAGGITEVITCLMAINTGMIPHTLNLVTPDEKLPALNLVSGQPVKKEIKAAMSNSFGFGGQNSSVIVRKYEG